MNIITTERIPIKIWTDFTEDGALKQAKNLANLPFTYKWVALMPDIHQGYGMPIGAVIATEGVVIPNAVGVDIGCGMKARKTNIKEVERNILKNILHHIQREIPTGFNHQKTPQKISDELMSIIQQFSYDNEHIKHIFGKIPKQMGTLGGGNHFIEIQIGDDQHVWIMLHSGSRGIGKMICDYYNTKAEKIHTKSQGYQAQDLAPLPLTSVQGMEYIQAMHIAMKFAEDNRLNMLEKITKIVGNYFPDMNYEEAIDTHHNYASMERHFGKEVLVHRKGAVRALGKVIIPGSMGSASYIGEGLKNPEAFYSCPHGAGRKLGRKEAARQFTAQQILEEMKGKQIELYKVKKHDVAEECAAAYKDIDRVINDSKTLVKPLVKLKPIGVVKG